MTFYYGNKPLNLVPPNIKKSLVEQKADGKALFKDKAKLLISDPGFGKTWSVCIGLAKVHKHCIEQNGKVGNVLVIVPPIALLQWGNWLDFLLGKLNLGVPTRIQLVKTGSDKIHPDTTHLVVTYGMLARQDAPMLAKLKAWKYKVIVCDEYECMANKDSKRTKNILGSGTSVGGNFGGASGLVQRAEWRWMLTGTPIPRYNDGLWPALSSLFPSLLRSYGVGDYTRFRATFCRTKLMKLPHMRFAKLTIIGSRNNQTLHNLLYKNNIAIRHKLELKKGYIEETITFDLGKNMTSDLKEALEAIKDDTIELDEYGNPVNEPSPKAMFARRLLGEAKVNQVAEYIVAQVASKRANKDGRGVLVLFWHRSVGHMLQEALNEANLRTALIHGGTSAQNKYVNGDKLNSGEIDVLIGQTQSMGVAINLQDNCNHAVFAEADWSHARTLQALQRVWRRGQGDTVRVDYMKALVGLEEPMYRVVAAKKKGAAEVLDHGSNFKH